MWKNALKNKRILLIIFLVLVITTLTILILFFQKPSSNTPSIVSLKNYVALKENLSSLLEPNAPDGAQATYDRIVNKLNLLESKNVSEKDKYGAILQIVAYITASYSYSHSQIYSTLLKDVGEFTKVNFPNKYNEKDFVYICQDPSCATNPMPDEIQNIIDEINQSSLDDTVKDTYTRNIINASYMPTTTNTDILAAINAYIIAAAVIKNDGAFTQAGLNEKINNDILNYLENKYPEQYKEVNK